MAWNPAMDALSRWQSASPADQNWYVSRGYGPMGQSEDLDAGISPWGRFGRVLNFRDAEMAGGNASPAPSSIADDPNSTWNTNQAGPRTWGTGSALRGLGSAMSPQTPEIRKR